MYKIIGADGVEYGPVTTQQVQQWILEGRANAQTRVQAVGTTEWKTIAESPEFSGFAGMGKPPPAGSFGAGMASPTSMQSLNPDAYAQEVINRGINLNIGDCISNGWELVKADFWPVVGVNAVVLLMLSIASATYVGAVLNGAFLAGLYCFFLKKIRRQPAQFNDVFAGFSATFVTLLVASLLVFFLSTVGLLLCILPGIYLSIAWAFTFGLIQDKKLDFWPAMEISRKVVTKIWFNVFLLAVVCGLINLLGTLLFCVGVFVTFPITMAAMVYAYESIFNPPGRV